MKEDYVNIKIKKSLKNKIRAMSGEKKMYEILSGIVAEYFEKQEKACQPVMQRDFENDNQN